MLDFLIVREERCLGVGRFSSRMIRVVKEVQIVLHHFLHHFNLGIGVHAPVPAKVFHWVGLELVG